MSLEAVIQENTNVMRELIARLSSSSLTAVQMTGSQLIEKIDAEVGKADTKAENKTAPVADVKPVAEETAAVDYDKDVRPVLVKVSTTKGRDALVALLAQFNATKGDQIKQADLAKALAAAQQILGV